MTKTGRANRAPDQGKRRACHWARAYLLPEMVVAVGVTLTLLSYFHVRNGEQAEVAARFQQMAYGHAEAVRHDLEEAVLVVESLAAFYASSKDVEPDEFRRFTQPLLARHPRIHALGWAPVVPHAQRAQLEADGERHFGARVDIFDRGPSGQRIRAADREVYIPLIYAEPPEFGAKAAGLDIAADPIRSKTLDQSIESGSVAASRWVVPMHNGDGQLGFLLALPVCKPGAPTDTPQQRREALVGFVGGMFQVGQLMADSLAGMPTGMVDVSVCDVSESVDAAHSHVSTGHDRSDPHAAPTAGPSGGPRYETVFTLAGRTWSVVCRPGPAFVTEAGAGPLPISMVTLISGLALTCLSAVHLNQLARHARRRERLIAEGLAANERLSAEVAERQRAELSLRAERDRAQSYLDLTGTMFIALDVNGTVTLVNPKGCEILGCCEQEVVGLNWFEHFVPAQDRQSVRAVFRQLMAGDVQPVEYYENAVKATDGSERILAWHNTLVKDADGRIAGTLASGLDITERKQAEETVRVSEAKFRAIYENAGGAIFIADAETGELLDCNHKAEQLIGRSHDEIIRMHQAELHPADEEQRYRECFARHAKAEGDTAVEGETEVVHADGRRIPVWIKAKAFSLGDYPVVAGLFLDITDQKKTEKRLQETNDRLESLAGQDPLTELPNRRRLLEVLGVELERVERYGGPLAVVMLDADHLKAVNDTYGHDLGDKALIAVAEALTCQTRKTDLVARYGGDEFVILMPNTTAEAAVDTVERIQAAIADRSVSDLKRSVTITVSAGICLAGRNDGKTDVGILKLADQALYAAKRDGRNGTRAWQDGADDPQLLDVMTDGDHTTELQKKVAELMHETKAVSVQGIWSLVQALEARDAYTRGHSENVTRYAVGVAEALGLGPKDVEIIRRAAMVHDIGKIGLPDAVLQKAAALTPAERVTVESHCLAGVRILQEMRLMEMEIPIVRCHHERWDGQGYPEGIGELAIPFGARIVSVADTLDAITSNRVYRKARDLQVALDIINAESGKQFDPDIVAALNQWVADVGIRLGFGAGITAEHLLSTQTEAVALSSNAMWL